MRIHDECIRMSRFVIPEGVLWIKKIKMTILEIKNRKLKINPSSGFTLLISLIVMSAVLVTGLGIADIVARDINLSSIGRESQIAFYAADTGAECALFWDIQAGALSSTTPADINCDGVSLNNIGGSDQFNFQFDTQSGSCVRVDVDFSGEKKIIQSHGFNTSCSSTELKKVERVLEVTY